MSEIIYCPICARHIEPEIIGDLDSDDGCSAIYVHDDIVHDDDDLEALENGVQ